MRDQQAEQLREQLLELLIERGVHGPQALVDELSDEALEGALGIVARFDEQGTDSTGLLVYRLRHDARELVGYRPPGQRTPAGTVPMGGEPPKPVTERLLTAVRGTCQSPDGFNRDMARDAFGKHAAARGLSADELIDRAMRADWQATPVSNPLKRQDLTPAEQARQYAEWVGAEDKRLPPPPMLKRI